MIITSKNTQEIDGLNLHDLWLDEMNYNHVQNRLTLLLTDEEKHCSRPLVANEVAFFHVNALQPWGRGHYVFDIEQVEEKTRLQMIQAAEAYRNLDQTPVTDPAIGFIITMNSGDTITVFCRSMEYDHNYGKTQEA